jgi:hypothetical protein
MTRSKWSTILLMGVLGLAFWGAMTAYVFPNVDGVLDTDRLRDRIGARAALRAVDVADGLDRQEATAVINWYVCTSCGACEPVDELRLLKNKWLAVARADRGGRCVGMVEVDLETGAIDSRLCRASLAACLPLPDAKPYGSFEELWNDAASLWPIPWPVHNR